MIPRAYLQEWSAKAPWPDLTQVEQDLIICRVLCDLFNAPKLKGRIAFRGGTGETRKWPCISPCDGERPWIFV